MVGLKRGEVHDGEKRRWECAKRVSGWGSKWKWMGGGEWREAQRSGERGKVDEGKQWRGKWKWIGGGSGVKWMEGGVEREAMDEAGKCMDLLRKRASEWGREGEYRTSFLVGCFRCL